uniref:Uncharacterized protein n=1 Tax=Nosema pernyi TaxID=1112939 RepID=X5E6A8_9MICR|nr:hypothetical protein NP_04F06 [Nosema pernyi]
MRKNVTMKRRNITRKDASKRIVLKRETVKVEKKEEGMIVKRETVKRIKKKGVSKNGNGDEQDTEDKHKTIGSKKADLEIVLPEETLTKIEMPKKAMIKKEVTSKETIKSGDFFKDLFEKYSIIETSDIYEEFDHFKKSHLDKLTFLNDQMLETYRLAFFYKFYNLKIPKIKYCGKTKVTMFNNALNEIKIESRNEEQHCGLICNLYSILNPINRNSS